MDPNLIKKKISQHHVQHPKMEQHCNFIKIGPAKPKKMLILCFSHPRPPRTLDPENPQKNRAYSKTA